MKDLSVTKTTHGELAGYGANVIKVLEQFFSDNPMIIALIVLLKKSLDKLNAALSAVRINSLIQEAYELDQIRDDAFMMFRDMIAVFGRSSDPAELAAYQELWPVIEKLGTTLYADGYLEESAKLETLYQEMKKPEKEAALSALSLEDKLERLKVADQNFNEVYDSKLEQKAKQSFPTIKEARAELKPLIADLLPTLRMMARTAPEGTDLSWVDLIDEHTNQVMAQIAARRTRKKNQDATGEE